MGTNKYKRLLTTTFPGWKIEQGRKHLKLRREGCPVTVTAPLTSSCSRAFDNLKSQIRNVERMHNL